VSISITALKPTVYWHHPPGDPRLRWSDVTEEEGCLANLLVEGRFLVDAHASWLEVAWQGTPYVNPAWARRERDLEAFSQPVASILQAAVESGHNVTQVIEAARELRDLMELAAVEAAADRVVANRGSDLVDERDFASSRGPKAEA
jgi:hypothetical protein